MAPPEVRGVGAQGAGMGAITPAFPTVDAPVADDILIGLGESVGNEAYTVPSGWAHVLGSPINVDTTTRLTVIWKRFVGGDTALSWGDSGNHNIGRIIAISDCKTSGDPWNVSPQVATETAANASVEWPAVTTTVDDCLILFCVATGRDIGSTSNMSALSGGTGLTSATERMDDWTALGTGGGFGMITAIKAAAGSTGSPTATVGSNDSKAVMTLALEPAAEATPITLTETATGVDALTVTATVPLDDAASAVDDVTVDTGAGPTEPDPNSYSFAGFGNGPMF